MNTLPLEGARKKPARRPRNDAIVKLAHRERALYCRVYKPGAKRATYRSLRTADTASAESIFPHVRAEILRTRQNPASQATENLQLPL